jgi:hypothetical protein
MKKTLYYFLILLAMVHCSPDKGIDSDERFEPVFSNDKKELVIIFDRYEKRTEFIDRSTASKESFYYRRENFDPPYDDLNLHIKVFHGLEDSTKIISRKELDKMTVWFDSEMEYMDWFEMRFETYYMIYQDEYLVKGSLDPNHEFVAYQVTKHVGGVE